MSTQCSFCQMNAPRHLEHCPYAVRKPAAGKKAVPAKSGILQKPPKIAEKIGILSINFDAFALNAEDALKVAALMARATMLRRDYSGHEMGYFTSGSFEIKVEIVNEKKVLKNEELP